MTKCIPVSRDELQEMLTDKKVMTELLDDPEDFGAFINNYVSASMTRDAGIAEQVKEQTDLFMTNWLRENGSAAADMSHKFNLSNPNTMARIRPSTIYNKKAIGAKYDSSFDSLGEYFHAISSHSYKDDVLSRKLGNLKNAMGSIKPADGGFLIPEVLRAEILRVALEKAIVRSRCRVIPMDSLTVPFPTVDASSNVSSVYGGITGYWTEEGATLTESQPRFGRVELRANKLVLYTEVPDELIRDAQPSMAAFIEDIFPEAAAWFEDVACFVGGGVGEPLGFLNAPAAISVTRSTTVAGENIEWIDIVNMFARMLPQSLSRAVWIVAPDALPSLLTMTVTTTSGAVWMGGGGFASGSMAPPMTMLGLPLIVSEKASAIGDSGDINLVDFGFYLLGDRQAMTARQSEDFKFDKDITAFRIIERIDGRPWLASAVTPMNGGATLSPFVKLTTHV